MGTPGSRPALYRAHRDGPTSGAVVFVHGSLDRARSFRRVAELLPEWDVVGYDRRGWGSSRSLGGPALRLETHVDDLCAVLAGFPAPPVVAGHSYGGLVALSAAARRPSLVCGLVVYEPPVRWLPWWPAHDPWAAAVREAGTGSPDQAARALMEKALGPAGRLWLARRPADELAADGAALVTEMTDPSAGEPLFDPLTLPVPAVVAAGTESVAHHREVSRRLADLLPGGRFASIEGARHDVQASHPGDLAGLIREMGGDGHDAAGVGERDLRDAGHARAADG
ncbi:alpha/beta fold hydrolase [Actinomadura sp. NTSP31]|uniref:alpha/beta fold hydrolase n=1 Tax=Actinomadura sp. NTSP31 TaxID=1735447 RepID=UPI0035C04D07